ncbi:MAG: hypothetical protein LLF94_06785 [Chlamydiales bacterium]|nr:hypothetical protein [Chlamydiales bacterium]
MKLEEGCREAIILCNGFIIDDHNRYSICSKHNLPFKAVEKQFEAKNDVCIWMIQNQFARCNLTAYVQGELEGPDLEQRMAMAKKLFKKDN